VIIYIGWSVSTRIMGVTAASIACDNQRRAMALGKSIKTREEGERVPALSRSSQ
jgi:hypothetical protein